MNRIASALEGVDAGMTTGIQLGSMSADRRNADARELRAQKAVIENKVINLANVGQYEAAVQLAEENNMPYLIDQVSGIRDTAVSDLITKAGSPRFDDDITRRGTIDFSNIESIEEGYQTGLSDRDKLGDVSTVFGGMDYGTPSVPPPVASPEDSASVTKQPFSFDAPPSVEQTTVTTDTPPTEPTVTRQIPQTHFERMRDRTASYIAQAEETMPKIKELRDQLIRINDVNLVDGIEGAKLEIDKYKNLLLTQGMSELDTSRIIDSIETDLQKTNNQAFLSMMQIPEVIQSPESVLVWIDKYNPSPHILKGFDVPIKLAQEGLLDEKLVKANNWLRKTVADASEIGDEALVRDWFANPPKFVTNNIDKEVIETYQAEALDYATKSEQAKLDLIRKDVENRWQTDKENYLTYKAEGATDEEIRSILRFPAYARSLGFNERLADDPSLWPVSLVESVVRKRQGLDVDPELRKEIRTESNLVQVSQVVDTIIEIGTGQKQHIRQGKRQPIPPEQNLKILAELKEYTDTLQPIMGDEPVGSFTAPDGSVVPFSSVYEGEHIGLNLEADVLQELFNRGYQMLPDGSIYNINDPSAVAAADEKLTQLLGTPENIAKYKTEQEIKRQKPSSKELTSNKRNKLIGIPWREDWREATPMHKGLGWLLDVPKDLSEYTAEEGEKEAQRRLKSMGR